MRFFLLVCFTLVFIVVYGTCDLLVSLIPYRVPISQPNVPFLPELAPLYLSLNLLIALAFFRIKNHEMPSFFTSLSIQTLLAGVVFLTLPLEAIKAPYQPDSWAFHLADRVNLTGNYLPSLHVAYAITCAYFLRRPLVTLWSLGIVTSTLLTHQHYSIDVVAGIALAILLCYWSLHRGRVFSLCLYELLRTSLRHRRYALISVGLLLHLLVRPKVGWTTLLGFSYLQRLDDLLDGQLKCTEEPEDIAQAQLGHWRGGRFPDDELSQLGSALHKRLGGTPKVELIIEEMMIDRRRVRDGLMLTAQELAQHLETTFQLSLDLMLESSGAELRSADLPSLAALLGWCSVVRDLEEDLALGLVNIPREIWGAGELVTWFEAEHQKAWVLYKQTEQSLDALKGRSGYGILRVFHRSVRKYLVAHQSRRLSAVAELSNPVLRRPCTI